MHCHVTAQRIFCSSFSSGFNMYGLHLPSRPWDHPSDLARPQPVAPKSRQNTIEFEYQSSVSSNLSSVGDTSDDRRTPDARSVRQTLPGRASSGSVGVESLRASIIARTPPLADRYWHAASSGAANRRVAVRRDPGCRRAQTAATRRTTRKIFTSNRRTERRQLARQLFEDRVQSSRRCCRHLSDKSS